MSTRTRSAPAPARLDAVPVKIAPGAIVHRRGASYVTGQVLYTTPDDAARLVENGNATRVRP